MEERSRTVTWNDPMEGAQRARDMDGLEFFRGVVEGRFPLAPFCDLLGIAMTEVSPGRTVFEGTPGEEHYNPIGAAHAGLAAALLDSAMGCAVQSLLPAGDLFTTLELKVNLTRPITTSTGRVSCEGTVLHSGRRIALAEAKVTDEQGRLLAHGTSTCLLLRADAEQS